MNSRRQLKIIFGTLIGIFAFIGLVNYWVDPYCWAHKPLFSQPIYLYDEKELYWNLGLIRNYLAKDKAFNTLILGSCRVENFDNQVIQEWLGGKVIKLALQDAYPVEIEAMLRAAIRTGHVKNVILGMDLNFYCAQVAGELSPKRPEFPFELYASCLLPWPWKLYVLFFHFSTFYQSLKILGLKADLYWVKKYFTDPFTYITDDFEKIYDWNASPRVQMAAKYWSSNWNAQWLKKGFRPELNKFKIKDKQTNFPAIDAHLISLVRDFPQVQFYIFFSPFHRVYFYQKEDAFLQRILSAMRVTCEKLASFSNVRLYSFFNFSFIEKLKGYFNEDHYLGEINALILDKMQQGKGLLTLENLEEQESQLEHWIHSFKFQIE